MSAKLEAMAEKAAALFKSFRKRAARHRRDIVIIESDTTVGLEVGKLVAVIYEKEGFKALRRHDFNSNNRPVLYSAFDGSQLYILAGGYRLTERGIVG